MEKLLDVEEVAPLVGLSVQRLYAYCREKRFPHVRLGRLIKIPSSGYQKWCEDQIKANTCNVKNEGGENESQE